MRETITFLLVTLSNIHRFKFFFHHRLSNKSFLIRLLTTPPYFKYVATLLCNLSLMSFFADMNVSQGSVATYARCGGIFDIRLTTNLPWKLPVKKILKSVRNYRVMVMSLWHRFFGPPCTSGRIVITTLVYNETALPRAQLPSSFGPTVQPLFVTSHPYSASLGPGPHREGT